MQNKTTLKYRLPPTKLVKLKGLARALITMWNSQNDHLLLVTMYIGALILENNTRIVSYDPAILFLIM